MTAFKSHVSLSQLPSPVPTANPICSRRRPACTACKSKYSGPCFAGSNDEREKSTLRFGEKGESRLFGHTCFWIGTARWLIRSSCAPLVAVVKTADLRYGNDGADVERVHGPRFRCVLSQREVRPGFVIVRQEGLHVPVQCSLVENDDVVEALAANRADDAFHVGTLPRRSRRRQTSLIPMALTSFENSPPKIRSRSRSRYRGI